MGPNLRKLLYASVLVTGAGVATYFTGGSTTAPLFGAAFGSLASLLGGVGGNFAHQIFDNLDHQGFGTVTSRALGIDENHHILLQLRRSYIKALRQLATDFQPEAVDLADRIFLRVLSQFLDEAECPARLLPQSEVTNEEKAVFAQLPDALRAGLSARNSEAGALTLANAAQAKTDLLRLAFDELAVEIGGYCPTTFLSLASRDEGGFVDLFVRDAAGALKENTAFCAIWSAEQQQHIRDDIRDLSRHMDERFDGVHSQLTEMEERIITAVSQAKGVPFDRLRPILARLGRTNVAESDYERVLSEAVDQLLAQSRERVLPTNMGPEVDDAIKATREKLRGLDTDGARGILNKAIAEQREKRQAEQRAEAALLVEKARVEETSFDYGAAVADLELALTLDADRLASWRRLGELYTRIGRSSQARAACEQMLREAERLNDTWWEMTACNDLGNVLHRQGNLPEALQAYRRGMDIAERLVGIENNAQTQRDLSVCLHHIGGVLFQQGAFTEALDAYERDLAITELLARDDNDNEAKRDLSITLNKIGEFLREQGNTEDALKAYQRGLAIREKLARDECNIVAQRDLSISLNEVGDILRQQGKLVDALEICERGLAISERLAKSQNDIEAQRDLSICLDRIGEILRLLGRLPEAHQVYTRGLIIAERIANDENDAQAQRDLWISYFRLAVISGDIKDWQKALDKLLAMNESGQLAPIDAPYIAVVQSNIDHLSAPPNEPT